MLLFRCSSAGNPVYVHCFIWLAVFILYNLNITGYTYWPTDKVFLMVASIVFPFVLGYFFVQVMYGDALSATGFVFEIEDVISSSSAINHLFKIFLATLAFEFAFEGYIPLFSMLKGASVTHFEFGISSLHGFVLALGAVVGTSYYLLYSFTKEKWILINIFLVFCVFALVVTRKMMVVLAVQMLMIDLLLFGVRNLFKYFMWILCVVFVFGVIGDVRIDREKFLSLASLNYEYPDYLPSGFIWVYIYMITPLANLLNLVYDTEIHYSWAPRFLMQLFPSVIRAHLFGENVDRGGSFSQEWLVSQAFNVSTGYAGIYTDFAIYGVVVFCFIVGMFSGALWRIKSDVRSFMACVVLNYCVISMIFSNDFVNLNVMFQLVLIRFVFVRRGRE